MHERFFSSEVVQNAVQPKQNYSIWTLGFSSWKSQRRTHVYIWISVNRIVLKYEHSFFQSLNIFRERVYICLAFFLTSVTKNILSFWINSLYLVDIFVHVVWIGFFYNSIYILSSNNIAKSQISTLLTVEWVLSLLTKWYIFLRKTCVNLKIQLPVMFT